MQKNGSENKMKPIPKKKPAQKNLSRKQGIQKAIWLTVVLSLALATVLAALLLSNQETSSEIVWQDEEEVTEAPIYSNNTTWFSLEGIGKGGTPQVVVENGEVHVIWLCTDEDDYYTRICYRHNDGNEWKSVEIIYENETLMAYYSPLVVENGKVHIAWQVMYYESGMNMTAVETYYRHHDGNAWQPIEKIAYQEDSFLIGALDIAAEDDEVYLAWSVMDFWNNEIGIYYKYFDGFEWKSEEKIANDGYFPTIAVENGKVYVAYSKGSMNYGSYVHYKYFENGIWHPEEKISSNGSVIQSIVVENGNIHLIWVAVDHVDYECSINSDYNVKYRHYNGTDWQPERAITTGDGFKFFIGQSFAVENDKVYIAWMQLDLSYMKMYQPGCEGIVFDGGTNESYYSYYDGEKWWPDEEISSGENSSSAFVPSIDVENDIIYVVWSEKGDEEYQYQIYFRKGIPPGQQLNLTGILIAGTIATSVAFSIGAIGTSEIGKFTFFSFFAVPLYTRLKRNEVLDNFVRGQIFQHIRAHPGDHYNSIMENVGITNGVCAYHLKVLTRQGFIKSAKDGKYLRFYPSEVEVPQEKGIQLSELQKKIINAIKLNPGITQIKVAELLRENRQTVNYNIIQLSRAGILYIEKSGRETYCYLVEYLAEKEENSEDT